MLLACPRGLGQAGRGTGLEVELVHRGGRGLELEGLEQRAAGDQDDVGAAVRELEAPVGLAQVREHRPTRRHAEAVQGGPRPAGQGDVPAALAVRYARAGVAQHRVEPHDLGEDPERLGRVQVAARGAAGDQAPLGQERDQRRDLRPSLVGQVGVGPFVLSTVGENQHSRHRCSSSRVALCGVPAAVSQLNVQFGPDRQDYTKSRQNHSTKQISIAHFSCFVNIFVFLIAVWKNNKFL